MSDHPVIEEHPTAEVIHEHASPEEHVVHPEVTEQSHPVVVEHIEPVVVAHV